MTTGQEQMRHRGAEPVCGTSADTGSRTSLDDTAVFVRLGAVVAVLIGCVAVIQSFGG